MEPLQTEPWEPTLDTPEDVEPFLDAAFEDGDPKVVASAIGWVSRKHGMTNVAEATGLGRESLYKALSGRDSPQYETLAKVLAALGYRLTVTRAA